MSGTRLEPFGMWTRNDPFRDQRPSIPQYCPAHDDYWSFSQKLRVTSNLPSAYSTPNSAGWNTIPEFVPGFVDVIRNIREAKSMSPAQFFNAVRNGGKWDFKQLWPAYQDFGNWHFGVVAKAYGIPLEIALRGAGFAQVSAGTSEKSFFSSLFDPSFGDAPLDQLQIRRGYLFNPDVDSCCGESIKIRAIEQSNDNLY